MKPILFNIATENGPFSSLIYLLKMVDRSIFLVCLPAGNNDMIS